jgi:hypothetical protein
VEKIAEINNPGLREDYIKLSSFFLHLDPFFSPLLQTFELFQYSDLHGPRLAMSSVRCTQFGAPYHAMTNPFTCSIDV